MFQSFPNFPFDVIVVPTLSGGHAIVEGRLLKRGAGVSNFIIKIKTLHSE